MSDVIVHDESVDSLARKQRKSRIVWYFKQLLPLKYKSEYWATRDSDGEKVKVTCVWRMWFGVCFNSVYSDGWDS